MPFDIEKIPDADVEKLLEITFSDQDADNEAALKELIPLLKPFKKIKFKFEKINLKCTQTFREFVVNFLKSISDIDSSCQIEDFDISDSNCLFKNDEPETPSSQFPSKRGGRIGKRELTQKIRFLLSFIVWIAARYALAMTVKIGKNKHLTHLKHLLLEMLISLVFAAELSNSHKPSLVFTVIASA